MVCSAAAAFNPSDGKGSTTWMAEKLLAAIQPLTSAPPMRPAPISRIAPLAGAIMGALSLARTFQHGGRHGFLRRLAAPEHELEGWIIMLAGFDREVEQRLALGGADPRIREDQDMAEQHRAVFGPKVEVAQPELRIDGH